MLIKWPHLLFEIYLKAICHICSVTLQTKSKFTNMYHWPYLGIIWNPPKFLTGESSYLYFLANHGISSTDYFNSTLTNLCIWPHKSTTVLRALKFQTQLMHTEISLPFICYWAKLMQSCYYSVCLASRAFSRICLAFLLSFHSSCTVNFINQISLPSWCFFLPCLLTQ